MESSKDYEIEIWVKKSTADLLKKFREDNDFEDNDDAIISLIKTFGAKKATN